MTSLYTTLTAHLFPHIFLWRPWRFFKPRHQLPSQALVSSCVLADNGRRSVALLHDLANELAVIVADDSSAVATPLTKIYQQLHHLLLETTLTMTTHSSELFSVVSYIRDVCLPKHVTEAARHNVSLQYTYDDTEVLNIHGEKQQLQLVMSVLIRNAIESYQHEATTDRSVWINIGRRRSWIYITVTDNGSGIPAAQRAQLFAARSTKASGHGIGLYISREIIRHHFRGELDIDNTTARTTFRINIPRYSKAYSQLKKV